MEIPTALVLLGAILTLGGGIHALVPSRNARHKSSPIVLVLVATLLLWGGAAVLLALSEFFLATPGSTVPKVLLGWIPAILLLLLASFSPRLRHFAQTLSPARLVLLNTPRALTGLAMVHTGLQGTLPGIFAFPAGLGGLLVGLTAPWCAHALSIDTPTAASWARLWTRLGLLDILLAMILGGLTAPGQPLSHPLPSTTSTAFPLSFIPSFLVPLYLLTHLLHLRPPKP